MNPSASASLANPVRALPPLPKAGGSDDLTPVQRRVMVASILLAHVAGVYGLLQVHAVRQAVLEAAPMFVDILTPPAPPAPPKPPPPPPQPQPVTRRPPPPDQVIAAAPSPAPSSFVVPAPPPEPAPPSPAPPAPAVAATPAPPAPPPPPRNIPASAVQFIEPPDVVYPRQSRRSAEAGTAVVRAYIDTNGLPRDVQIERSSGFVRLDQAAVAAVQKARLKPHTENGRPVEGWLRLPINFELEK